MGEAWAVVVGAAIGAGCTLAAQWLGLGWQHRHWLMDQKKAEYREMLTKSGELDWALQIGGTSLDEPAALPRATHSLWTTVANRIFTNDAIVKSRAVEELGALTKGLAQGTLAGEDLHKQWYKFHAILRRTAQADLGLRKPPTEEPDA